MAEDTAKIRAYSPGRFPILVAEFPSGELKTLYFETGYDPELAKPVGEDWLRENAIGRHSFIGVEPPREIAVSDDLGDYVRREILSS